MSSTAKSEGYLKKAYSRLKSAKLLYENRCYDEAVGMAYYSVFHAVCAVLASDGVERTSHKGVISYFNKEFINTGRMSSLSYNLLNELYNGRSLYEYDSTAGADAGHADNAVKRAESGLIEIEKYLREHPF